MSGVLFEVLSMAAKASSAEKDPFAIAFGQQVARLRNEAGFTQKQLANKAKYDSVSLSRVETGEMVPKVDTVARLAAALNVDAGVFFQHGAAQSKNAKASAPSDRPRALEERVSSLESDKKVLQAQLLKTARTAEAAMERLDQLEAQQPRQRKKPA